MKNPTQSVIPSHRIDDNHYCTSITDFSILVVVKFLHLMDHITVTLIHKGYPVLVVRSLSYPVLVLYRDNGF